jgi:hypothetical protein
MEDENLVNNDFPAVASPPFTDCDADPNPGIHSVAHPASWFARNESGDRQFSVWHPATGLHRQQGQRLAYESPKGYDERYTDDTHSHSSQGCQCPRTEEISIRLPPSRRRNQGAQSRQLIRFLHVPNRLDGLSLDQWQLF